MHPSNPLFIAGTDTEIGKTTVTCQLLKRYAQRATRTLALKPIASEAEKTQHGLRNSDAQQLAMNATLKPDYHEINPWCFEPPIAPHIAAEQTQVKLNVRQIADHCQTIIAKYQPEHTLIEGVGGICVPLNDQETTLDWVKALGCPVLLVVGMRLGCINHALLSVKVLEQANVPLIGWIANTLDPNMRCFDQNVTTLKQRITAPLLEIMPYLED